MKRNTAAIVLAYLTLYVVWGSTYLAIRVAVTTLPPFYLVSLRFLASGGAFLLISALRGGFKRPPSLREILSAVFLGFALLILGNGLVSEGERTVDSYVAAVIISSTPFCVALFNKLLYGERLNRLRLLGMALGLAGVAAVLWSPGKGIGLSPGILLVIGGFAAWAFATSAARGLPVHPDSLVNSGLEMSAAGIMAGVYSLFAYGPPQAALAAVDAKSWLALGYLAVFGGGAFYAYTYLIAKEPSIRVVSYSIVNPLIAVILGMAILGEAPVPLLGLGVPAILAGLVLMLYGEAIGQRIGLARRTKSAGE